MTYHPLNWHDCGHVAVFEFWSLPWCSTLREFVSDGWSLFDVIDQWSWLTAGVYSRAVLSASKARVPMRLCYQASLTKWSQSLSINNSATPTSHAHDVHCDCPCRNPFVMFACLSSVDCSLLSADGTWLTCQTCQVLLCCMVKQYTLVCHACD